MNPPSETNNQHPGGAGRNDLIDRERIRGATRMIAEGTDAKDVTEKQIHEVAADVELLRRNFKISRKAIAKSNGYSPGVITEFLLNKYAGNNGQVAIDLQNWLIEEENRRSRPQTTQFTWTNVARQIQAAANYCLDFKKIGLVYGPDTSGIGKTMALQAIHQQLGPRRSTLVTIDEVDANPTGLLKKILSSMHIDDKGANRNRFQRILNALTGRSHILLIDQIQNLRGSKDDKPFYILADLFDATKSAQLWCGTADLVAYLQREQTRKHDESLAQIRRRIFPCIDLMESVRGGGGEPLATIDQVREMFAKNKLKITPAGFRFLCTIANTPDSGSVGLCASIVEYATTIAEQRRLGSIDVPILTVALRLGLTDHRAELLLAEMDLKETPLSKVG